MFFGNFLAFVAIVKEHIFGDARDRNVTNKVNEIDDCDFRLPKRLRSWISLLLPSVKQFAEAHLRTSSIFRNIAGGSLDLTSQLGIIAAKLSVERLHQGTLVGSAANNSGSEAFEYPLQQK